MKVFIALTILLSAHVFGDLSYAMQGELQSEMDFARKAVKDGFYDLAEDRLGSLLSMDIPERDEAEAHMLLGRICYEKSLLRKAMQEFDFVAARSDNSGMVDMALYWTAEVNFKEGNYDRALEVYQSVLDRYPSSDYAPYAYYSKAWCYEALGENGAAIEIFREAAESYPESELAIKCRYKMAEILYRQKSYKEAISALESFIGKYPVNEKIFDAYCMLGDCYYKNGNFAEAIANLTRSLRSSADHPWRAGVEYEIARSYMRLAEGSGTDKGLPTDETRHPDGYYDYIRKSREWLIRAENDSLSPDLSGEVMIALAGANEITDGTEAAINVLRELIRDIPENEWTDDAFYFLGEYLYEQGRAQESIEVYREGIDRFPDSEFAGEMSYNAAWAYLGLGDKAAALAEFERTVKVSRDEDTSVRALCGVGDILEAQGKDNEAIDTYDRVLDGYPYSALSEYAQYQVGYILRKTDRPDAAILAFQSLLFNFPQSDYRDKSIYQLGLLYAQKGDFITSVSCFERILSDFRSSALYCEALLQKANSLYNSGDFVPAMEIYEDILRTSGDERLLLHAEYHMGWAYYRTGQDGKALALFENMLAKNEDSSLVPGIKLWFGEYYYGKGKFDKANSYLEEIIRDYPGSLFTIDALYWQGWVFYDKDMVHKAIERFIEIAEKYPDSKWAPRAILTAGDIFKKRGSHNEAVIQYKVLLRKYPGSSITNIANNRIGIILKERGRHALAIEYFKVALTGENTETNARTQFDIAECCEKMGKEDEAVAEYLKVEYKYPRGNFWVIRSLVKCAEIFEKKGNTEKAKDIYKKLAEGEGQEAEYARGKIKLLKK